jgi:hypothetical protein
VVVVGDGTTTGATTGASKIKEKQRKSIMKHFFFF